MRSKLLFLEEREGVLWIVDTKQKKNDPRASCIMHNV